MSYAGPSRTPLHWPLLAMALAQPAALGQWTAINMHPAGAQRSEILAGANGAFGGYVIPAQNANYRPALWTALSSAWTDLLGSATQTEGGEVYGMWGNQQGGYNRGGAIWSGTPESIVHLDPVPSPSFVYGIGPGQQAGVLGVVVSGSTHQHAVMWSGTPGSRVDLNPAGHEESWALASDGEFQGGWARGTDGNNRAALWHGTAASYVDMDAPWSSGFSEILGMVPGQQVGFTLRPAPDGDRATIWSGSAQSAIDVHPFPGYGESRLLATTGTIQVGWSNVPGYVWGHAGVWFGSADSFVDLNQFLPREYFSSEATCVFTRDGQVYVGGIAATGASIQAFVWVLPEPGATVVLAFGLGLLAPRRRRTPLSRTP